MGRRFIFMVLIISNVFFLSSLTKAVPGFINYQGKLTNSSGNTLNGNYSMIFSLYNTETEGIALWRETQNIMVIDGIFNVQLGIEDPLSSDLFNINTLYLEIEIFNSDSGLIEILTPRQQFTSTAFAMKAENAAYAYKAGELNFALTASHSISFNDIRAYGNNLNNVLASIGAKEQSLLINDTVILDSDIIIPETLALSFTRSGIIDLAGHNLTFKKGYIEAGAWQIFNGTGIISFSDGSKVKSAWFTDFCTAIENIHTARIELEICGREIVTRDIKCGSNIILKFSTPDDYLIPNSGVTVTIYSPENIVAGSRQQIVDIINNSIDPICFQEAGTVYPGWWGAVSEWTNNPDIIARTTVAIQCSMDALPTSTTWSGVNTVQWDTYGGHVHFPHGMYLINKSIIIRPFLEISGESWRNTIIRLNNSNNIPHEDYITILVHDENGEQQETSVYPVFFADNARWCYYHDFSIETSSQASEGQHGLCFYSHDGKGGQQSRIERLGFYYCYDGIHVYGAGFTMSSWNNLYIRKSKNDGINIDSASTLNIQTAYISNPGRHGVCIEKGAGTCNFTGVCTESTGMDGLHMRGIGRCTFNSCYIGDKIGGYGINLTDSYSSSFENCMVCGSDIGKSAILLNGCSDIKFDGAIFGQWDRYIVEWSNKDIYGKLILPEKSILINEISLRENVRSGTLGVVNDYSYIRLIGTHEIQLDTTHSPLDHPFESTMYNIDKFSFLSRDSDSDHATNWSTPDPRERWSFYKEHPGTDNYSLLSRGNYTIGNMLASEDLEPSLLTGDDSEFTTGTGNWIENNVGITSVPGGHSGQCLQIVAMDPNFWCYAKLQLSGLTAGKLYKLDLYAKAYNDEHRAYICIYDSQQRNRLRYTQDFGYRDSWIQNSAYWVASSEQDWIYICLWYKNLRYGQGVLIDTITIREIKASGELRLSGGRQYSTSYGGGGGIKLVGNDATSDAGTVQLQTPPTGNFQFQQNGIIKLFTFQNDSFAHKREVNLPESTSGMVFVSCNNEAGMWLVQNNGGTTKIAGSTNTSDSETEMNICVYDGGGNSTVVKNLLGYIGEIRIFYYYN